MSRRDTIIVAVLVNAALLMILFATANRKEQSEVKLQKENQMVVAPPKDDPLAHYVTSVPTPAEIEDEPLTFTEDIELAFTPPSQPIEENKPTEKAKPEIPLVEVTVKKGDYLEKIANANNTTVSAIMQANHLASTQLKIGQVLKVPLSEKQSKPAPSQAQAVEYYVVKEGDNPWLIATRHKLKLEELLRLNGLDEQKARRLRPGDRLRIR